MATIGETMTAIQACTTEDEAKEFISDSIDDVMFARPELVREEARTIVMQNIGYLVGYLDRDEAARLLALFGTRHPIFGAIDEWPQSPEETIALGMKFAERVKKAGR